MSAARSFRQCRVPWKEPACPSPRRSEPPRSSPPSPEPAAPAPAAEPPEEPKMQWTRRLYSWASVGTTFAYGTTYGSANAGAGLLLQHGIAPNVELGYAF